MALRLAASIADARQISDELRTISYLLHPPLLDELGLGSALRWYAEGFEKRSGITAFWKQAKLFLLITLYYAKVNNPEGVWHSMLQAKPRLEMDA